MKKKVSAIVLAAGLLVGGASLFVTNTYALEQTISIDDVNYVSLQQMSEKYNFAFKQDGEVITIIGEAVNLTINKSNNLFTINGVDFLAQELPEEHDGQVWVTTKDWADLFNLELTHYDGVSQMEPITTEAVTTPVIKAEGDYEVSKEWGDKIPEGVRKHGSPQNIETPHNEVPIYESKHENPLIEKTLQGL